MRRSTRAGVVAGLVIATAGAVPTGANAANENAVCIGELISFVATTAPPGTVGAFASGNARAWGGIGRVVGQEASSDTCG